MTLKEMLERAQQKMEAARTIVINPSATADEKASVPALMAEAKQLKADADLLMTIDREGGVLAEAAKSARQEQAQQDAPVEWKSWGEFLDASYRAQKGGRPDPRLRLHEDDAPQSGSRKDMSGADGTSGGYLIPPVFNAQLMSIAAESAVVRPYANVQPMTRREMIFPALKQTAVIGAGIPPWFGGLQAYWIGEGQAKPASDADFREIRLVAKKLAMFTRASDELLDDSAIPLAAFLSGPQGMAGAIVWMEDFAFLWGSGVAQPLGILNSPATLTVPRDVSGKVLYSDVVRMVTSFYGMNGRWSFSQSVYGDLLRMEDTEGHLIWATGAEGGARTLLGYPYRITEKMAPKGTTGDIMLADFGAYIIGDRQATTVESTKFEAWQYDKTSWRAIHRGDGQPWLDAPLTLQDGTTQQSPFVVLSSDVS